MALPKAVIQNPDDTASGTLASQAAAIAQSASLSSLIDLGYLRPVRLVMPAAWDAAALTFQVSEDGVTLANLYDSSGNEYTVQAAASRAVILPAIDFVGVRYMKIRSGTSGAPVNQTAARSITVISQ